MRKGRLRASKGAQNGPRRSARHKNCAETQHSVGTEGVNTLHISQNVKTLISIIRFCTNKTALKFTLLKQHIKMIVLFKKS